MASFPVFERFQNLKRRMLIITWAARFYLHPQTIEWELNRVTKQKVAWELILTR